MATLQKALIVIAVNGKAKSPDVDFRSWSSHEVLTQCGVVQPNFAAHKLPLAHK